MVSCNKQCTLASGRISSPNDAFPLGDLSEKRYSKRGSHAKRGVRVIWFSPPGTDEAKLSGQVVEGGPEIVDYIPDEDSDSADGIFRDGCCRPEYKACLVARCFTPLLGSRRELRIDGVLRSSSKQSPLRS
jgi:hypothetical protein